MTKKTLYICGDSFCSSDQDYGDNWSDMLAKDHPELNVINLSTFGASNYLVYLQVKHALDQNCDYLIYHATSSVRQEFVITRDNTTFDKFDRYWNQNTQDPSKTMASLSWLDPRKGASNFYSNKKIDAINNFFKEFIDFNVLVEKNYIFIQYTLQLISKNKNLKNWVWSRGGFEHNSFGSINEWDFDFYADHHCKVNLWDHYDPALALKRPYYHITDKRLLEEVSELYYNLLFNQGCV